MGGASEIAFNIIPVIEKSGGKVLVRAMVDEVIVEGRQTVGVKVRRCGPSGPEGGSIDIRAPAVISNAGVYNTLQRLLVIVQSLSQFSKNRICFVLQPAHIAKKSKICHSVDNLKPGLAGISIFVGLVRHSR